MSSCSGQSSSPRPSQGQSPVNLPERSNYETNKSTGRDTSTGVSAHNRENPRLRTNTSQERGASASRYGGTSTSNRRDELPDVHQSSVTQPSNDFQRPGSITVSNRQPVAVRMTAEDIKVHRGPLNLSAVTLRDPKIIYEELFVIIESLGITVKRAEKFTMKCELRELRFSIEINSVEKFSAIYVIKFFKSSQAVENYSEICTRVFSKLNL